MDQFDLFPEQVTVQRLEGRAAAGAQSRVQAVFVVRYERERTPHQVFHDRHGWYCAEHGKGCRAVKDARRD